jgi:hypothetical protein
MKAINYIFTFLFFIVVLYLFIQFKYYTSRYYSFDPFTQIHCPKYEFSEVIKNDLIILCLGGSTTNDGRLNEEDKYPTILEKKLQSLYPDKSVVVLNGGMDWYTTKHSLINFTTYYKKINPDLVIIMHAINDICRSFTPIEFSLGDYKSDYSHYYGPAYNAANPPIFENFVARKFLGDSKYQSLRWNLQPASFDLDSFKSFSDFSYYYSNLVDAVLNNGSKCIILEQPTLLDEEMNEKNQSLLWFGRSLCNNGYTYPDYNSLNSAMKLYNSSADSIASFFNIPFVKTDSNIPKNIIYYKDDVHHTSATTEKIAESVKLAIEINCIFD